MAKEAPIMKLFNGSLDDPLTYEGDWTKKQIIEWLTETTGIRFTLQSCIASLDEIAEKYANSSPEERVKLLERAKEIANGIKGRKEESAQLYIKYMELINERGNSYISSEESRLKNLMGGKISKSNNQILKGKLNILKSFKRKKNKSKTPKEPQSQEPKQSETTEETEQKEQEKTKEPSEPTKPTELKDEL